MVVKVQLAQTLGTQAEQLPFSQMRSEQQAAAPPCAESLEQAEPAAAQVGPGGVGGVEGVHVLFWQVAPPQHFWPFLHFLPGLMQRQRPVWLLPLPLPFGSLQKLVQQSASLVQRLSEGLGPHGRFSSMTSARRGLASPSRPAGCRRAPAPGIPAASAANPVASPARRESRPARIRASRSKVPASMSSPPCPAPGACWFLAPNPKPRSANGASALLNGHQVRRAAYMMYPVSSTT